MGGEEVEPARKDNSNSRESLTVKKGMGTGVVGRWRYWVKKVVGFLKRGNITVYLNVGGSGVPLEGKGLMIQQQEGAPAQVEVLEYLRK